MAEDNDYICALTGLAAANDTLVDDADDDDLGDMPEGWTRVTLERRVRNPEYLLLIGVIEGGIQQALAQIPAEHQEAARPSMEIAVRAQFAAMLQMIPAYLVETEEVYLAPEDLDSSVVAAMTEFRKMLSLPLDEKPEPEKPEKPATKKGKK